jgi:uncharacterized DUF497 family protein
MKMEFSGFEWDRGNRSKCQKHGISIGTIESAFIRGVTIFPDETHSKKERRLRAIGYTENGRAIFIAFTLRRRGKNQYIRPISVRYMHAKEIKSYEKNEKETADFQKRS